jgi:hypothetical protein
MSGFAFKDEKFLIFAGVILVVLAIAYALDFTRRRHLLEKIGNATQLARMAASVSPGRRRLKALLMVLGGASTSCWRWTSRSRCWPPTRTRVASSAAGSRPIASCRSSRATASGW